MLLVPCIACSWGGKSRGLWLTVYQLCWALEQLGACFRSADGRAAYLLGLLCRSLQAPAAGAPDWGVDYGPAKPLQAQTAGGYYPHA